MIHVQILTHTSGPILSGATAGRSAALAMAEALPDLPGDPPVVLDFSGVEIATASFLREAVLGFRQLIRHDYPSLLLQNLGSATLEDLREVLTARNEVIAVLPSLNDEQQAPKLIGELEPKLRKIFETLQLEGGLTARELAEKYPDEGLSTVTAWNNRLAALAELGLAVSERIGRSKVYSSILEAQDHGHRLH